MRGTSQGRDRAPVERQYAARRGVIHTWARCKRTQSNRRIPVQCCAGIRPICW